MSGVSPRLGAPSPVAHPAGYIAPRRGLPDPPSAVGWEDLTSKWIRSGPCVTLPDGSEAIRPIAMFSGGGYSDDAVMINDSLRRTGYTRLIPGLTYTLKTAVVPPSGSTLDGVKGGKHNTTGAILQPYASFSDAAVIYFAGGDSEQVIRGVSIDGSLMTAGTADGIGSAGTTQYVTLDTVLVAGAGIEYGVHPSSASGAQSNGWRMNAVVVNGANSTGFLMSNSPDGNWIDCQAIGCGGHGWSLNNNQNTLMTQCRGDFSTEFGFNIFGTWTDGAGSGGMTMNGISTDRNGQHGILISAAGNSPVLITGLQTRRDGSSSTSSGYAGLAVDGATVPVLVSGWYCFPGTSDSGTGNDSPEYGLNLIGTNTLVQVDNAMLHAVSAGVNGSSGLSNRNLWTRTGSTSSPSAPALTADSA